MKELRNEIESSITELIPLYETVTTSDLQGICEGRAMFIVRKHKLNMEDINVLSDEILDGIYERMEV
jgi:hypothetical protein